MTSAVTSHEQLHALARELDLVSNRVHPLSDAVWGTRPAPETWSVAECIAHLNLTSRAFLVPLREAIARAPQLETASRPYRRDLAGRLIGLVAGPSLRVAGRRFVRLRTTDAFIPTGPCPRAETMDEFDSLQRLIGEIIRQSEGKAIDRVKISSPFDRRVSYTVYSALTIIPRHQIRHIQQADTASRRSPSASEHAPD